MDMGTSELVAIGAAVTANCEPCLQYHVNKAQECGVGAEDIREAIAMGQKVRQGSTANMGRIIGEVLDGLGATDSSTTEHAAAASCCG